MRKITIREPHFDIQRALYPYQELTTRKDVNRHVGMCVRSLSRGSCDYLQSRSLHMWHSHINVSCGRLIYMWMTAHDSHMKAFIIYISKWARDWLTQAEKSVRRTLYREPTRDVSTPCLHVHMPRHMSTSHVNVTCQRQRATRTCERV